MTAINFHPPKEWLEQFAKAELSPSLSIMVSAHLEYCPHCRAQVAEYDRQQLNDLAQASEESLEPRLQTMLQEITEQPEASREPVDPGGLARPQTLQLNGYEFHLPRAMRAHSQRIGPWNRLPGRIQRAKVAQTSSTNMSFVYMDKNTQLPRHQHQGQEITLVLEGHFSDQHAHYRPGDFIVLDGKLSHQPRTDDRDHCLCLTLLDAPLRFSSGLASLLNPFARLLFR